MSTDAVSTDAVSTDAVSTDAVSTGGAGPPAPPGRPYRALIWFWAAVLILLGAGAVTLQVLGPIPGARPPAPPPAEAPAETKPPPAPAAAPPTPAPPPVLGALPTPSATAIRDPDPALQEPAPDLPGRTLPQIGSDNRTAAAIYAAPFDATDKHPRVALVLDGLGLDQEQTLRALKELPGGISIAFSAYMPESLEPDMAAAARRTGHECLLSIPMEPSGYPLSEEGARSLLTGTDIEQNRQNLEWALSRMPGCVGATGASDGLNGERFAQTGQTFGDVLSEIAKRGLLYLDPRTGAPALSGAPGTRVVDMIVDQPPNPEQPLTPEMIDLRLGTLERLAAERGTAIGLAGPPRPVMLERIAVWARGLAARGLVLAPLTAIPAPAPAEPAAQ